jgi:hypothetical protein
MPPRINLCQLVSVEVDISQFQLESADVSWNQQMPAGFEEQGTMSYARAVFM